MSDVGTSDNHNGKAPGKDALERERYELLRRLENWLETPMLLLAFGWLALLVAELVWGESFSFEILGVMIWAVFILDFSVELVLAPLSLSWLSPFCYLKSPCRRSVFSSR